MDQMIEPVNAAAFDCGGGVNDEWTSTCPLESTSSFYPKRIFYR